MKVYPIITVFILHCVSCIQITSGNQTITPPPAPLSYQLTSNTLHRLIYIEPNRHIEELANVSLYAETDHFAMPRPNHPPSYHISSYRRQQMFKGKSHVPFLVKDIEKLHLSYLDGWQRQAWIHGWMQ